MRLRSIICALASSVVLFACGGAAQKEANTAEADPWADYKGTYATGAPKTADAKDAAKDAKKDAKKEAKADVKAKADKDKPAPKEEAPAEAKAAPATPAKPKTSAATINGESVSSIGMDTLAGATKTALKAKAATSKFTTGPQYEHLQVQTKSGASVLIIRPAAYPDADGPAKESPKAKQGQLGKGETAFYDEDADVLVVVNAGKKAGSQKVLGSLVAH